jgi:tetratricopeptide (TPR) repeat protein
MNRHSRISYLFILPLVLLLLAPSAAAQIRTEDRGGVYPGGNSNPHPPSRPHGPSGIEGEKTVPEPRADRKRRRTEDAYAAKVASLYIKLGDDAMKMQPPDYQQAVRAYQNAASLDPKEVRAYERLGESYAALGDYDRAALSYNMALQLKPKKAELHYQLGVVFQKMGEPAAAREKLQLLRELKKKELAAKLEAQLNAPPGQ